ncbi:hypothetical protein QAD02_007520 [Eretmocerus hayati]|uniref:Uncharacterized protein n=1 Tax=Eretmocerus hayati TaxID=131215 RepID=A0ACC2N3X5_9HYME|nr:hypothetical protein QAD02_007520 [Eretmocerus hayati]
MRQNRKHITDRLRVLREQLMQDLQDESCDEGIDHVTPVVHPRIPKDNITNDLGITNESSISNDEFTPSSGTSDVGLQGIQSAMRIKYQGSLYIHSKPRIYLQRKRENTVLKGPWAGRLSESVWDAQKTPRDFAFKRCHVSDSEKNAYYMKSEGVYRETRCSAEVLGFCEKEPPPDADLVFHIFSRFLC